MRALSRQKRIAIELILARHGGKPSSAPDPFIAPYFSYLPDRTPKAQPAEPRSWRKDEYPD